MTAVLAFKTTYKGEKPTHWVHLAPSLAESEKVSTWHRVDRLRPAETDDVTILNSPSYRAMQARWEIIEPKLQAWLAGSEIPEDGTPLAAWGGLNSEQVDILRSFKIRTVEDVVNMRDSDIQKIPLPDMRKLRGMSADFLANKDVVQTQAEMADMREKMAAMEAMLQEQQPKKRGRPAKDEAA